jgi:hypothetical protein
MRLCDMSEAEIENQYGPMVRAAGYAGARSMINDLNMWGDDEASLVARCQPRLYDSETADPVTAEELGITAAEYRQAIIDSHKTGTHEGHIRVNGRRVYANN